MRVRRLWWVSLLLLALAFVSFQLFSVSNHSMAAHKTPPVSFLKYGVRTFIRTPHHFPHRLALPPVVGSGAFTAFALTAGAQPYGMALGPDGNVWFTQQGATPLAKITAGGTVTSYALPAGGASATGIAVGPDGNLWFTDPLGGRVGKITTSGVVTEYPVSATMSNPFEIITGPDGNLWFTSNGQARIGKITPTGVLRNYVLSGSSSGIDLAVGPDGNIWVTLSDGNVAKITPGGVEVEYALPQSVINAAGICEGSDGNLWITDSVRSQIVKLTTSGVATVYVLPTSYSGPAFITPGPDGNLWFTDNSADRIGKITTTGVVTEFSIPAANAALEHLVFSGNGDLWFAENGVDQIGRFVSSLANWTATPLPPTATPYPTATPTSLPADSCITVGLCITSFTANSSPQIPYGLAYFTATVNRNLSLSTWTLYIYDDTGYGYQACYYGTTCMATDYETQPTSKVFHAALVQNFYTALFNIPGQKSLTEIWAYPTPSPTSTSTPTATQTNTPPPTVTLVPLPTQATGLVSSGIDEGIIPSNPSNPSAITRGPDGNMWFTEQWTNKIGMVTPSFGFKEYLVPSTGGAPSSIATGSDGNLWFTESGTNKIGKVTPGGQFTEYVVPTALSNPIGITAGADGNLWFTEQLGGKIGRITTTGVVKEFAVGPGELDNITYARDGTLWFTEPLANVIGSLNPSTGQVSRYTASVSGSPHGITTGPNGNIWFTESFGSAIGEVSLTGTVTQHPLPLGLDAEGITSGPDGNLWFTESAVNKIGRMTVGGKFTEFLIPTANTGPHAIAMGPQGDLWFTETSANGIGRYGLSAHPIVSTMTAAQISRHLVVEHVRSPVHTLTRANGKVHIVTTYRSIIRQSYVYRYLMLPVLHAATSTVARGRSVPAASSKLSIGRLHVVNAPVWDRTFDLVGQGSMQFDIVHARGAMRFQQSAGLGSGGLAVVYGESDAYGSVFKSLGGLQKGDTVVFTLGKRTVRYTVQSVHTVSPSDTRLLNAHYSKPTVALITSTAGNKDAQRIVVIAG